MAEQKYRDSLFRHYFKEKPRLLSLINALLGTNATDPDAIEINTLEGNFFSVIKNDISCIFEGRYLVLIEHQSTVNPNMPSRMFFYLGDMMKRLAGGLKPYYKETFIEYPAPEFFVIYNGRKKAVEHEIMRLSKAFHNSKKIELIVEFYNINKDNNRPTVERSKPLSDYCSFVDRVETNRENGMTLDQAIKEAMDYCIPNDIMSDYLKDHYWEVMNMYEFEFTQEMAEEARYEEGIEIGIERGIAKGVEIGIERGIAEGIEQGIEKGIEQGIEKGIEQGIEKGIEQGIEQGIAKTAINMFKMDMPINIIMKATGLTESQIRAAIVEDKDNKSDIKH